MRIEKIKKKQILLYLPFPTIPKAQKEPPQIQKSPYFLYFEVTIQLPAE